jgi:antitoxin MazE
MHPDGPKAVPTKSKDKKKKPVYSLNELLAGMTPENRHDEVDFGAPVGREVF